MWTVNTVNTDEKSKQAKKDMRNGEKNEAKPERKGTKLPAGKIQLNLTWDRHEVDGKVQRNIREKFYDEQKAKMEREVAAESEMRKQANEVLAGTKTKKK